MRDVRRRTDLYWKVPVGLLLALIFLGLPVLAVGFLVYQVGQFAPRTPTADGPAPLTPVHAPSQGPPEPPAADNLETILLPDDAGVPRVALGPVAGEQPLSLVPLNDIGRHDGRVCSAVLSDNEQHVLSASADGTVRLWRLSTSTELHRLQGHRGTVWGAVYAGKVGKGSRVASVGADGTLRLWDLQAGKQLQCIPAHDGPAFALAASPRRTQLVSGGRDRAVRIWDAATGARVAEYTGHSATVLCVAVSPDGRYVLAGCADGSAVTWDLKSGRQVRRMRLGQPVNAVRFLPDGRHALLGGDWSCCCWDVLEGQRMPGSRGDPIPIRSAAPLRGGRYALTGGGDGKLALAYIPTGAAGRPFPEQLTHLVLAEAAGAHAGAIHAVDASADSARAVTAGADGRIRFWQVEAPPYLQVRGLPITGLAVDPAGRHAVSGEQDGRLTYWDLDRGEALRTLSPHSDGVEAIAFSPDGKRLFSCSPRLRRVQDVARAAGVLSLEHSTAALLRAAFSADGKWLAGVDSAACCVFDLETGKCAWQARPRNGRIIAAHFLSDGRLFSATDRGEMFVREAATGALVRSYRLGEAAVSACVPSRDGGRVWLATWSPARGFAVAGWDLEARRELVRFTGLPAEVRRLALSPDGRSLLGAGGRCFHVWGLEPPRSRWHVQTWQSDVTEIAYLPNGRQVLVADHQGGLRRWDLPADQ